MRSAAAAALAGTLAACASTPRGGRATDPSTAEAAADGRGGADVATITGIDEVATGLEMPWG